MALSRTAAKVDGTVILRLLILVSMVCHELYIMFHVQHDSIMIARIYIIIVYYVHTQEY